MVHNGETDADVVDAYAVAPQDVNAFSFHSPFWPSGPLSFPWFSLGFSGLGPSGGVSLGPFASLLGPGPLQFAGLTGPAPFYLFHLDAFDNIELAAILSDRLQGVGMQRHSWNCLGGHVALNGCR